MTFEFDAEKYIKASSHQKLWGKRLIPELNLKENDKILDIGCGDGYLTAILAEFVPDGSVIGIDASMNMIQAARENYHSENIRFDLMDINTIDFEGEFNVVFSNATLHWIKDHLRLLANVHKSLKHGGILRFNFAADGNCSNFFRVIKKAMTQKKYAPYFSNFDWPWYMPTIDEYEKILKRFSFKEVKVWSENADNYFANEQEMIRWIEQPSLVPFLKCVAKSDKQTFRDTVIEQMIKNTAQPDGRCFETFRRINVLAKK